MFKSTIIVTILGLVAKILAFLRDIFIASSFGTTWATDSYNVAITATNVIYSVIGIVLTSSLIPLIGKIESKEGDEGVNKLCSNIINIFVIIAIIGIAFVFLFTDEITKVMAPLFTKEAKALTSTLIRISALSLIPMVLNSVFNAILQYKHDFIGANMSTLAINLSIIVMILLVPDMSIIALITITMIASFIQVIVQIPWIIKHKFKYSIGIKIDNNVHFLMKAGFPLLMGTFATQLNNILDKSIASTLPEGSISALSNAFKIVSLPHVIFGYAIVTVAFPYIAKLYNNKDNLYEFIENTNLYIAIIMVFSTAYLIFMRTEVVTVLFGYGKFDSNSIANTSLALAGYCVGLAFLAIKDIYIRVFYTINDSKYVMKNTMITVVINLILNLALVKFLGIIALALSTSIASAITTFLCKRRVNERLGVKSNKKSSINMLKIIAASIIAVLPMSILNNYLITAINLDRFISLILVSILSALIYGLVIYGLRIGDVREQVNSYWLKFKKTQN